jgi:hypothetical protein
MEAQFWKTRATANSETDLKNGETFPPASESTAKRAHMYSQISQQISSEKYQLLACNKYRNKYHLKSTNCRHATIATNMQHSKNITEPT